MFLKPEAVMRKIGAKSIKTAYKFIYHNRLAREIPGIRGIVVYESELTAILEDLPCKGRNEAPHSSTKAGDGRSRVLTVERDFTAFFQKTSGRKTRSHGKRKSGRRYSPDGFSDSKSRSQGPL
jgi:hypothetical protein